MYVHVLFSLSPQNPSLPYTDSSFDVVLCALSIDYLTKPLDLLREISRVLRPHGLCMFAFSNRLFSTKAVAHWTATGDADHIYAVGSYIHFAGSFSEPIGNDYCGNITSSLPSRIDSCTVAYQIRGWCPFLLPFLRWIDISFPLYNS